MKNIHAMTEKEFRDVPYREHWDEPVFCTSLILLPSKAKQKDLFIFKIRNWLNWNFPKVFPTPDIYDNIKGVHDSGYSVIDAVACDRYYPICRVSGCSDIVHINGIGGMGRSYEKDYSQPAWSIDCLPKSGLFRLFTYKKIEVSSALSSLEVFSVNVGDTTTPVKIISRSKQNVLTKVKDKIKCLVK